MVRLKNRWLIVRVDAAADECRNPWPSKRDLFFLLTDTFTENFGITYAGALRESNVQLSDNLSRLILVKTPRHIAAKMRVVLACLTRLAAGDDNAPTVVFTVVGEHGSLRTAKRSIITKLRQAYKAHLTRIANDQEKHKVGQSLLASLQELRAIDF